MGLLEQHVPKSHGRQVASPGEVSPSRWLYSLDSTDLAVDPTTSVSPLRNACGCIASSSDHTRQPTPQQPIESPKEEEESETVGKQNASGATDSSNRSGGEKNNTPIFACPYLRRYPVRHKDCLNLRLKRIRDVKQHLQRRHFPSLYYCPICFLKFPSEIRRDSHVRSQQCERRDPTTEDLVSPRAQAMLKQPVSRKLSPAAQWYSIWETLFPTRPLPSNPYLGTVVEEGVGMIRKFWDRHGNGLVAKHLNMSKAGSVNNEQLNQLMMRLLDDVSGRLEQRAPETEVARASPTISSVSTDFDLDSGFADTNFINLEQWNDMQMPDDILAFLGEADSVPFFFSDELEISSSLNSSSTEYTGSMKGEASFLP